MDRAIEQSKWQKNKKFVFIGAALLAFSILYYTTFIYGKNTVWVSREEVRISTVTNEVFHDYISYLGYVEPIRTIYLDAVEGGMIEELFIEEGATLQKGDEILRLSNTDLHLSIMNSEAALAEQINRLRDTKLATEQQYLNLKNAIIEQKYALASLLRESERNKKMYEEEFISKEEYLKSQENYQLAKERYELLREKMKIDSLNRLVQIEQLSASLNRMNANLNLVQNKLENLVVKAPVAGQLGTLNAEIGQAISRGQRLGVINDLTSYKVRMQVDEHYASRVKRGQKATIKHDERTFSLEVKKVYPEIKGGTFEVDLTFSDSVPANIRTGLSYRVKLEMSDPEESVVVKKGLYFQQTAGKWVFVLNKDGDKATRRNISVGKQNMKEIQVEDGLKPGDKIISSDYEEFLTADEVKIKL